MFQLFFSVSKALRNCAWRASLVGGSAVVLAVACSSPPEFDSSPATPAASSAGVTFDATGQALGILDGPEGPAVERTLKPLRELGAPGEVFVTELLETYYQSGNFYQSVYFYNPAPSYSEMHLQLEAQRLDGSVEPNHSFSGLVLVHKPGQPEQSLKFMPNSSGSRTYDGFGEPGWYALHFAYNASSSQSRLKFAATGAAGAALPTYWLDPPEGVNLRIEMKVHAEHQGPLFLKGGTFRNAQRYEAAYLDYLYLDGWAMYRRGFNQGLFNYPLGVIPSGEHSIDFQLSSSGPSKSWIGVSAESFDPVSHATEWAPVQFLYQGDMHTGDYDAWIEGVAFAQGPELVPGDVRPPPVRRGGEFTIVAQHDELSWGSAQLEVYELAGGTPLGWQATRELDYTGGVWAGTAGRSARDREHWDVQVPAEAPVGRYRLRVRAPTGAQIGQDVLFYVVHDPYRMLDAQQISKAELEAYGYDEDEDGVSIYGNVGSDMDHYRDHFTANYAPVDVTPHYQDTKVTGAFRRTTTTPGYSMLDHAVAAAEGTTTEFESMRRLYRLISQRVGYGRLDIRDNTERFLLSSNFTPEDSARVAEQGALLEPEKTLQGECFDYATSLAAVARSVGILTRSVSVKLLGGWGNHVLTEAFIPQLPQHEGKVIPYSWAPDSDWDRWYVFDATDPLAGLQPPQSWSFGTEAIAPRAQYGLSDQLTLGRSVASVALTNGVNWDPLSDRADSSTVVDVTDAYSDGSPFWLIDSSTTGWLGKGEKEVYRIHPDSAGAQRIRVRALPGGSAELRPTLCVVSAALDPALPSGCPAPGTDLPIPAGDSIVVVFNDRLAEPSHRGDSVQYLIELVY